MEKFSTSYTLPPSIEPCLPFSFLSSIPMANVIIALLAALLFLQVIQHGEGRGLKSPHRTKTPLVTPHSKILTKETKAAATYSPKISETPNKRKHGIDEFILPAKNLQIRQKKESLVQVLPVQNQVVESFQSSSAAPPPPPGHADSFRPTDPGHSPGVGHSLGN